MINWLEIDTVLLDMDGTLLDLHFDNYFWHEHLPKHWADKHGLDHQQARDELIPRINAIKGTLNWYCLDHWSRELELNIMEIKQDIRHKIRYRADSEFFLKTMKQSRMNVVMVTNAHRDLVELKFNMLGLGDYFDTVVSSHDIGHAKEDIQFWQQLEDVINYQKERAVLFDDNLTVLETARQYGIENLISIINPDSQKPHREVEGFNAISDFQEITDLL